MSTIVQTNAYLCSFNKLINYFSCEGLSSNEMIIRKVSPSPKTTCLRPFSSGVNSTSGVLKVDDFNFSF